MKHQYCSKVFIGLFRNGIKNKDKKNKIKLYNLCYFNYIVILPLMMKNYNLNKRLMICSTLQFYKENMMVLDVYIKIKYHIAEVE